MSCRSTAWGAVASSLVTACALGLFVEASAPSVAGSTALLGERGGYPDHAPRWSPDGRRISFLRGSFDHSSLGLIRRSGSGLHTLPGNFWAVWSPDGGRMALLNGRAIWLANGDGSHRRRIGSNGASAAWSPDGKTLALDLNGRLWGVNRDGTGLRRIPIEVPTCANCTSDEGNPSWSPDGHTLVFEHGEAEPGSWGVGSIWAADVDGGNVRRLSGSYNPHDPRWSADGTKVAYLMDDGFGDVDYLHVVNPDGSGDHRYRPATTFTWAPHGALLAYEASSNPKRVYVIRSAGAVVALKRASAPTWAPDGRRLAFQRGNSIYMASASGKRQRRLAAGIQPSWSPDGGLLAYAGAACGAQQGIHLIRASGTGKRRLTNFCFRKRRA